jgi:hypothetical protein
MDGKVVGTVQAQYRVWLEHKSVSRRYQQTRQRLQADTRHRPAINNISIRERNRLHKHDKTVHRKGRRNVAHWQHHRMCT